MALLAWTTLSAQSTDRQPDPHDGFVVTAWTVKDGLPTRNISAIAQDTTGFLWLGTDTGLVRFDGFQFARVTGTGTVLPENRIAALVVSRSSDLWIGFDDDGGVSRLHGGRVTNYSARDGLPDGVGLALLEDRAGTIWTAGRGGVAVFRDGRWQRLPPGAGLPAGDVFSLYEDGRGDMWVGTPGGVYRRAAGTATFVLADATSRYVQSFARDDEGTLWMTDRLATVRALRLDGAVPVVSAAARPMGNSWNLLLDSRGNVWVAALGGGLFRIHQAAGQREPVMTRVHYETRIEGAARYVFEDRAHNIWVGLRAGGLVRLSSGPIRTHVQLDGMTNDGVRALVAAADGSTWVASGRTLHRFRGGLQTSYPVAQIVALHADRSGVLWMATPRGIGPFIDGRLKPLPLPASFRPEQVISLATDRDGGVWLCNTRDGISRWINGQVVRFDAVPGVALKPCNFAFVDSRNRAWLGFTAGGVAVYEHNRFRIVTPADGLAAGGVAAIYEDSDRAIWLSAVGGLSRVTDEAVVTLSERNGMPRKPVPSLLEDSDGQMWVGIDSGLGLIRFAKSEVDKVAADPGYTIRKTSYDESDGLQWPLTWWSRPTAVRSVDGRLWFASGGGVTIVNPHDLPAPEPPAPPHIDRMVVDGRELAPGTGTLPAHSLMLQIDYGVLDLSAASKLRFRYMLEGFSTVWVDAGQRRQVSYTNLQPGNYRFRVEATSHGSWNGIETSWPFSVEPPFYRTYWFYSLCGLALAAFILSLWWLRLRSLRKEYAIVLAERARVSREIHDTLLQSLGGFTLQLEVALRLLDPTQVQTGDTLRNLRRQVGRCIQDARQTVRTLRSPRLEADGLAEALREMAAEIMSTSPVNIQVEVRGKRKSASPRIDQELLRIGQEAMRNAVRHGHAEEITVTLAFQRDAVRLVIADDGVGFTPDAAPDADTADGDHWGLGIMKERAEHISGRVEISSAPSKGTVVDTYVPV